MKLYHPELDRTIEVLSEDSAAVHKKNGWVEANDDPVTVSPSQGPLEPPPEVVDGGSLPPQDDLKKGRGRVKEGDST